jgi:hypothetical protein
MNTVLRAGDQDIFGLKVRSWTAAMLGLALPVAATCAAWALLGNGSTQHHLLHHASDVISQTPHKEPSAASHGEPALQCATGAHTSHCRSSDDATV